MNTLRKAHLIIAGKLSLLVIGMFGFGYLMVPIYNILCDITGLNGKTSSVAVVAPESTEAVDRTVTCLLYTSPSPRDS